MTLGACNTGGEKKISAAGKNDLEDADAAGAERNREINAVEAAALLEAISCNHTWQRGHSNVFKCFSMNNIYTPLFFKETNLKIKDGHIS